MVVGLGFVGDGDDAGGGCGFTGSSCGHGGCYSRPFLFYFSILTGDRVCDCACMFVMVVDLRIDLHVWWW